MPAEVLKKLTAGAYNPGEYGFFNRFTTFIPYGFDFKGRGRSKTEQLDYFIVSEDITIKRLETFFENPELIDHGCFTEASAAEAVVVAEKAKGRAVDVFKKDGSSCVKSGAAAYGTLREGSDYLPLILEFSVR